MESELQSLRAPPLTVLGAAVQDAPLPLAQLPVHPLQGLPEISNPNWLVRPPRQKSLDDDKARGLSLED